MNKCKPCFQTREYTKGITFALLALRLVVGAAFILHGWPKIQNPMSWMGPEAPMPGILLALAALSEFGGGIGLILGLLTPLASLGIACTMFVATMIHAVVKGDPFVGRDGSYELALVYFCIAVLFFFTGPGCLALDRKIFGPKNPAA